MAMRCVHCITPWPLGQRLLPPWTATARSDRRTNELRARQGPLPPANDGAAGGGARERILRVFEALRTQG